MVGFQQYHWKNHGVEVNGDRNFTEENLKAILYNCKHKTQENNKVQNITEIIVDQRLCNFSDQLASFGFNLHLITLPEFHVTAFNMHKLSSEFVDDGINAFVKNGCESNLKEKKVKFETIKNDEKIINNSITF